MDIKEILLQPFEKQLEALKSKRHPDVDEFIKQFEPASHKVMQRPNKEVGSGTKKRTVFTAKLPIPYQKKIVGFRTAFLFGNPAKYVLNDETDKFKTQYDEIDAIMQGAKTKYFDRKLAKTVMSETHAAELWYVLKDTGKSEKTKVMLLSEGNKDGLYPHFDDTGDMDAFLRTYAITDEKNKEELHADIYTAERIYKGSKPSGGGWVTEEEDNIFGKIPIVYYEQAEPEWADVQAIIERQETALSVHADVNDYYGDPVALIRANVKSGFTKGEGGKAIVISPDMDTNGKPTYGTVEYLTWNEMPESRKMEYENLKDIIYSQTATPDLSFNNIQTIKSVSGVLVKMMFLDAIYEAKNKEEVFGIGLLRRYNILKAIVSGTKAGSGSLDEMDVEVEFDYSAPTDINEFIESLILATGGEAVMTQEAAVRINPLVSDPEAEIESLEQTRQEARPMEDVFGDEAVE
ncbi:phage portal protein [Candidatus Pacearchaeota archaeon]|nr:phage portal protein [Candidatus Pacearchaeota archaeon]